MAQTHRNFKHAEVGSFLVPFTTHYHRPVVGKSAFLRSCGLLRGFNTMNITSPIGGKEAMIDGVPCYRSKGERRRASMVRRTVIMISLPKAQAIANKIGTNQAKHAYIELEKRIRGQGTTAIATPLEIQSAAVAAPAGSEQRDMHIHVTVEEGTKGGNSSARSGLLSRIISFMGR